MKPPAEVWVIVNARGKFAGADAHPSLAHDTAARKTLAYPAHAPFDVHRYVLAPPHARKES